ncbi:MAG: ATP-binding cassette domain-containing protein, partial [Geminicoccaceae bacterium]
MTSAAAALRPTTRPTTRPVYELRGVSKTYARRDVHALDDIDLQLAKGSFSAVIGSSGCGKSTLLKIMAGLVPP